MSNLNYTDSEKERYAKMGMYSAMILQGRNLEEIAKIENTTVEKVRGILEGLKDINPALYQQVKEM